MILEIRVPYCNVQIHPKQYYDVESQKFLMEKYEKIKSFGLHEIIDDNIHNRIFIDYSYRKLIHDEGKEYDENGNRVYKGWFTPPDDNWED